MDYEKKYKEALDNANVMHKCGNSNVKQIMEQLFPELKESKDDKARKELYDFCIKCSRGETVVNQQTDYQRWAAWLEKQGEKKPAWSEEDEEMIDDTIICLKKPFPYALDFEQPFIKNIDWLKSLKDRMKGE